MIQDGQPSLDVPARACAEFEPLQRVRYVDAPSRTDLVGRITAELSRTHVRVRTANGFVFAVARADPVVLPDEDPAS